MTRSLKQTAGEKALTFMKTFLPGMMTMALLLGGSALAQDQRPRDEQNRDGRAGFNARDEQAARDWHNQHKDHPPAGFRNQDRLSADEDSRLREGAVLDNNLRRKVHPIPSDLRHQLAPPPPDHRYVAIGGHIGLIDNNFHVKAVIRLHE